LGRCRSSLNGKEGEKDDVKARGGEDESVSWRVEEHTKVEEWDARHSEVGKRGLGRGQGRERGKETGREAEEAIVDVEERGRGFRLVDVSHPSSSPVPSLNPSWYQLTS
jgi:hypothetical protein